MNLDERLTWLLVGCVIGFFLGYISRGLKGHGRESSNMTSSTKGEVSREDRGIIRNGAVMDGALLLVVLLTMWASFASQKASNDLHQTQDRLTNVTICNQQYLSKTIKALNERTTYTRAQAQANVELQKSQAQFLNVLLINPPAPKADRVTALQNYVRSLTKFVTVTGRSDQKAESYPYPTPGELSACLDSKETS